MSTGAQLRIALLSILLSAVGCCGCGSGGSTGIVAQVGSVPITRATLSHWMSVVAGGDYVDQFGTRAPRGLASDPPNYKACIAAAEAIVSRSTAGRSRLGRAQSAVRCEQLYQALKRQALSLLISINWSFGEGAEQGVTATDAQAHRMLDQLKAEQFPKEGEYRTYLAYRGWVPSDELFQLKQNVVSMKLLAKFKHSAARSGDGPQAYAYAYGKLIATNARKWRAKTTCRVGYVVPQCKGYTPSRTSSTNPSPAVLLEDLAAGR
jgi:hypothetical protein